LQGIRSRVSYRVARCFNCPAFFAQTILELSQNENSIVRYLSMPNPISITNITEAASPQVFAKYKHFANFLGLK
jgi:hypothetical protein